MSWDPAWEDVFRARTWGRYPPEELVRFVARTFSDAPRREDVRILELGCGPGANVWYLAREGFAAHGIDGSATAIEQARARLAAEGLHAELAVGDFTELVRRYGAASFEAVVDVASIQHNRADAAARCLEQVAAVLRPGGRVFSMLVAAASWGDGLGREVEPRTFVDIREGPLAGTGLCRFSTLADVERLFAPFAETEIEYSERSAGGRRHVYRHWVATATRAA